MSAAGELFSDFWAWRMEESPELASFCGDHTHDAHLDDVSEEGYRRRAKGAEAFLARCAEVLSTPSLGDKDRQNVSLLEEDLRVYLAGIKFKGYLFPVSYAEGIHIDFELITSWMKFKTVEDFNTYLLRLRALRTRIHQVESLLRRGVEQGLTLHKLSLEGVEEEFNLIDKPAEETIFFGPFKSASTDLDLKSMKMEAIACIDGEVKPAFKRLKDYIFTEYSKHLRPSEGVACLPGGRGFYEACLHWHLSIKMTPEEVHQCGIEEVARIKKRMLKVIEDIGFKGPFKQFLAHLRSEDKFYFQDKDSMLKGYQTLCKDIIRPKLKQLFHSIPKSPLVIEASPESRPNAPVGYYLAGTLDGSRPGKFFVNTSNLRACPKYEMLTLALHEGEPGHHFQGMYAIEMKDMPMFRQYMEDMNYFATPSRFPLHTAYAEGWGLYCEYLGEEMGLYKDPYSMFGHLSFEMHRACRLIVDTGLNVLGWSYAEAKTQFMENTALSEAFIDTELRRYITWPGQACAYKIGELKIKELRKFAADKLGAQFDVRDFHEVVLKVGIAPLNVLQQAVEDYVTEKS